MHLQDASETISNILFLESTNIKRNFITISLNDNNSPNNKDLLILDNRISIEEIKIFKNRINANNLSRKLLYVIPYILLVIGAIVATIEITVIDDKDKVYVISFLAVLIIAGSILIFRRIPWITKRLFQNINEELKFKNIYFYIPDINYEHKTIQIWKKEFFEINSQ